MTEHETIVELNSYNDSPYDACLSEEGCGKAIKALEAQVKLKECIATLDHPEYAHLTWSHEELLKLLKEHVADYTERSRV